MKKLCLAVSALAFNFGVYLLLPELPVASASGPAQEKEESAEKEPKGQLTLKQQWVRRETFLSLGSYYGVVFSRDSARFALGTSNGKVLVYGNERGEEPLVIDAEKYVVKLCFTPDGIKILSLGDYPLGSGGKAPKLWSLESKECVWTPTPYSAYCGDFCFSPDGSLLATYGVDYKPVVYSIRIWDVKTKTHMQTLKTYIVSKMAFTPDGKKVAFCMQ
ncbi:MAG TPA: hypothetical protein VFA15_04495, partial [Nitrososphaera sp.]|nr:hypothetical protein [Nitrososphaera sp.]